MASALLIGPDSITKFQSLLQNHSSIHEMSHLALFLLFHKAVHEKVFFYIIVFSFFTDCKTFTL